MHKIITAEKTGKTVDLIPPAVVEGELELWLVDLVCPFATDENKLAHACLYDLITGPLKGQRLNMHKIDPKTAQKTVLEIGGQRHETLFVVYFIDSNIVLGGTSMCR